MAYTGPVKIRQGSIEELISLYKQTYAKLTREIIDATDAGKIQKARVMARINVELEALGVDVDKWARREIPQYYLDGANIAQQDLRALGVDINKNKNFAVVNKEAIAALTDEVALAFAQSITAVSRNSRQLLSDALKQQLNFIIAQGKLEGETRKAISAGVVQNLKDNGITALQDKAGKNWQFENYARMLVRTKGAEARNQGLANRMLTSGYDLVQVSNHRTDHPACAAWEGRILSLTGNTPGYPTLQQAITAGLFHPNCEHAINVIIPGLAELTTAYDNPYNYREAGATDKDMVTGKSQAKAQQIDVFHGTGGMAVAAHNNMFGNAFYVARDPATAAKFGKVSNGILSIKPGDMMVISDQQHYNAFVTQAIREFPGDAQEAMPKYAAKLGYKAIEASPDFDELGGIAIFDKSLLKSSSRPYAALQLEIEKARNAGNLAAVEKLTEGLPADYKSGLAALNVTKTTRHLVTDPITGKTIIVD